MISETSEIEPGAPPPVDYVKGAAWSVGLNIFTKATVGVIAIYIARTLGPREMGIFGLLATIYLFAEQMREAGLKQAFYNDNAITEVKFRTYARLSVISGITFGLILALLSQPLAWFFRVEQFTWAVLWVALGTLLNGISVIPMASLHKSGRFRDVGLIETAANLASALVSLGMVLMGWGFPALVAQLVVRAAVQLALAYWQRPFSILGHDRQDARSIMRVCTPLVATDVLWLFYSLADQLTIGRLLGVLGNGFYSQGKKILTIPTDFVHMPLARTVAVAVGNRSGDPRHLAQTFMKAICLGVLLLGMIYAVSAALARPIGVALLTSKFEGTIYVFGVICLSEGFKTIGSYAGSALVAAGRSRIPLVAWILPYPVAAAGLLLSRHLFPGPNGASPLLEIRGLQAIAWSYAAGMMLVNVVVVAAAFRILRPEKAQIGRFFESILAVAATGLIAYGISLLQLRPWPHVLLALAVIPLAHALMVGTVFARNPFAYLRRSGLQRLRESL